MKVRTELIISEHHKILANDFPLFGLKVRIRSLLGMNRMAITGCADKHIIEVYLKRIYWVLHRNEAKTYLKVFDTLRHESLHIALNECLTEHEEKEVEFIQNLLEPDFMFSLLEEKDGFLKAGGKA